MCSGLHNLLNLREITDNLMVTVETQGHSIYCISMASCSKNGHMLPLKMTVDKGVQEVLLPHTEPHLMSPEILFTAAQQ